MWLQIATMKLEEHINVRQNLETLGVWWVRSERECESISGLEEIGFNISDELFIQKLGLGF